MLAALVVFDKEPEFLDATDGLAAAVCHYFQRDNVGGGKSYKGWKGFLQDNPDRVG